MKDVTDEAEQLAIDHALNVGTPSAVKNIHEVIEAKRIAYLTGFARCAEIKDAEIELIKTENRIRLRVERQLSEQRRSQNIAEAEARSYSHCAKETYETAANLDWMPERVLVWLKGRMP